MDRFTDIPGVRVGHADDPRALTGVTVIIPDAPCVMAVDVRGGAPGTRETDALDPACLVERVHGVVLAGGSVFGLAAADAVALALSRRGIGIATATLPVPVVPAAILFDLANGGDKAWGEPPYRTLADAALTALGALDTSGPLGAGAGARAGSRCGGIGTASAAFDGWRVGALIAVNSFGEVVEGAPPEGPVPMPKLTTARALAAGTNTTIGVVATDAPLTRVQVRRLALMAHDGLARAIRPIHTPFDGDTLFALSTAPPDAPSVGPVELTLLGTLAADAVARAVRRSVG